MTEEKFINQELNISPDYFPILAENGKMCFCIPKTGNFLILEYVDGQSSSAIDDSPNLNPQENVDPKIVVLNSERSTLNQDLRMSDISAFLEKVFQQNDLEDICSMVGFRYEDIVGERVGERAEKLVARSFDRAKEDILLRSIAELYFPLCYRRHLSQDETLTNITNVIRKTVGRRKSMSEVDVLVITGLPDERDIFVSCTGDNKWEEIRDSSDLPFHKQTITNEEGQSLTIAVASASRMGETATAGKAGGLIGELQPKCLAMVGICAGRKGKVNLGDVIVAERVFNFDYGKLKRFYDEKEGLIGEEVFRDLETYNIHPVWQADLQNVKNNPISWIDQDLKDTRPKSYDHQKSWLLNKLYECELNSENYHPSSAELTVERAQNCRNWQYVSDKLEQEKLVEIDDSIKLTEKGRKIIRKSRVKNPDRIYVSDPLVPVMHLAPIGSTGNKVIEDPELFSRLDIFERKTLGVEMESAAIGLVGSLHRVEVIVVKGVSDYADYDKNDGFHEYAAKASAKFLIAFLKKHSIPKR